MSVLAIRLENFMAFADTDWMELRPISLLFGRNSSGKSTIIRALRLLRQSLDIPPDSSPIKRRDQLRFVAEYGLNQGDFAATIHYPVLVPNPSQFRKPEASSEDAKDGKKDEDESEDNRINQQEEYVLHSGASEQTTKPDFHVPTQEEVRQPSNEIFSFHFRCKLDDYVTEQVLIRVNQYRKNSKQDSIAVDVEDRMEQIGWLDFTLRFARSHENSANAEARWLTELVGVEIQCSWQDIDDPLIILSANRLSEIIEKETIEGTEFPKTWLWLPDWNIYTDILSGHKVEEGDWGEVGISRQIGFLPHLIIPDDIRCVKSGLLYEEIEFVDNLLAEFKRTITDFLQGILYIGPIRPEPRRSYAFDQLQMEIWRKQGWEAYLNFLRGQLGGSNVVDKIGEWMDLLDLGKSIRIHSEDIGNLGFVSRVQISESEEPVEFNLRDIGMGMSQILPILIQCQVAGEGDFIIIEQPELHLHPLAQAQLGDLFAQTIYAESASQAAFKSDNPDHRLNQIRFLLETHSEHLLTRLQSRVAETFAIEKSKNPISLNETVKMHKEVNRKRKPFTYLARQHFVSYYITREDGISEIGMIELGDDGDLINVPSTFEDFFVDNLLETVALARARNSVIEEDARND